MGEKRPIVGILAYGSLIDDPGAEIGAATVRIVREGITTPFKVEFARSSKEREGAPTLVPVLAGGAFVSAQLIIVNVNKEEAEHRLWRREINRVGDLSRSYCRPAKPRSTSVLVDFAEIAGAVALYTSIAPNISPLNPKRLAELAIESARWLRDGRDGISYLINTKRHGIRTPLSPAYEEEIKRLTQSNSLEEALQSISGAHLSSE